MNITSDNVSTNDVAMKELQKLLHLFEDEDVGFEFYAKQQRSQYVFYYFFCSHLILHG